MMGVAPSTVKAGVVNGNDHVNYVNNDALISVETRCSADHYLESHVDLHTAQIQLFACTDVFISVIEGEKYLYVL